MIIEHYKASELTTNNWSGGTTTQLAIYPKDADYKKLDFLFRISTATIETEESVFTKLPEVSRKLMILDGEIKIEHKDRYTTILKKFEQDEFSGNWDTISYGKATDFNLMTTGNVKGDIEAFTFTSLKNLNIKSEIDCCAIYIYSGEINLSIQDKTIKGKKGDILLLFLEQSESSIEVVPSKKSEIILSEIKFKI